MIKQSSHPASDIKQERNEKISENWILWKQRHHTKYNYTRQSIVKSKKISNDQELIQSDPISCPQNQKGNN